MNSFLIRLISVFRKIYLALGIDFEQLKAIVGVKLMMDNRRNNASFMRGKSTNNQESNNRFLITLFIYCFLGIFISAYVGIIDVPIISMSIFNGFIMLILSMTLITDYASILLDTADNMILFSRPIDSRTLFAARLTHITLYIGQILFATAFAPSCVVVFKYGFIVLLGFLITAIMSAFFALFLTSIIYLIVMQFASKERLKDVINYLQIVMAVFVFAFYQLMPRLFDIKDMENVVFEPAWWNFLVPPIWMGGTVDTLISHNFDRSHSIFIVLCFTIPLLGLWFIARYFSVFFNEQLSSLSTEFVTSSKLQNTPSVSKSQNGDISTWLSRFVTSSPVESGVFQFVWKQLARDRKLRLRLYPQFAYFFVMIAVMIFSVFKNGSFTDILEGLRATKMYLILIYMGSTSLTASLSLIPYSDDFKAAWIYYSLPVEKPGVVLMGALKAQIFKFLLPLYTFLSFILLAIWGHSVVVDLIYGILNVFTIILIYVLANKPLLPFSEEINSQAASSPFARSLMNFFIFAAIGGLHYFLTTIPHLTLTLIPIQFFIIYLMIKKYSNMPWEKINLASF